MAKLLGFLVAAALVAAFSWPVPGSQAGHVSVCFNVGTMESYLLARDETIERIAHLRGADAEAFMDVYNAIPPVTAYVVDEVIGFYGPGNSNVLFIVFQHGCYAGRALLSVGAVRRLYPYIELPGRLPGDPA